MQTEFDDHLTATQWDTLRMLRPTGWPTAKLNRYVLDQLVALGLVAMDGQEPALTAEGRAVVLRGSPRLWDLAA